MRSRKKLISELNSVELSNNGTPLRQMTITESFKTNKVKLREKNIEKMQSPSVPSSILSEADIESCNAESLLCFHGLRRQKGRLHFPLGSDNEDSESDKALDAPSPTKIRKTMITLNKPKTSTPLKSSQKSTSHIITPQISKINPVSFSSKTSRQSSSESVTDSVNHSVGSIESTNSNHPNTTTTYKHKQIQKIQKSADEISPSNEVTRNKVIVQEIFTLNDPLNFENPLENTLEQPEHDDVTKVPKSGKRQSGSTIVKRLDFNSLPPGNSEVRPIKSKKRNNVNNKGIKRWSNKTNGDQIQENNIVKENLSPNENNAEMERGLEQYSSRNSNILGDIGKAQLQSTTVNLETLPRCSTDVSIASRNGQPRIGNQNLYVQEENSTKVNDTTVKTISNSVQVQNVTVLNKISNHTSTSSPSLKSRHVDEIAEILRLKQESSLKVISSPLKNNGTSQNSGDKTEGNNEYPKKYNGTPDKQKLSSSKKILPQQFTPGCLINRKESSKNGSVSLISNKNENLPRPNPRNVQDDLKTVSESLTTSVNKNQTLSTKKVTIEKTLEQPCCSNSLDKGKQVVRSYEENCAQNKEVTSNKICVSTQKQIIAGDVLVGKSPPKKAFDSPAKGSPSRSRAAIKTLKAKEGKQLQVKQMDELVGLLKSVAQNRHLRNILSKGSEQDILIKFIRMDDNNKYIVMKLFVWKKTWYNIFDFCTKAHVIVDDDKDIIDIFEYLREESFVDTDYIKTANILELLNKLNRKEVKSILEELNIKPVKQSKEENVKTLLKMANTQATLTCTKSTKDLIMERIKKKMGFCIKIKDEVYNTLFNAYLLATFTNPEFTDIQIYFRNIVHLKIVFPEYNTEDYVVFYSKETFLSYANALKTKRSLDEQLVNKEVNKNLNILNIGYEAYSQLRNLEFEENNHNVFLETPHLQKYTAKHVYASTLTTCCVHIFTKKNGYPAEVRKWLEYLIKKFPSSQKLGKWYHKLIWLHMRHLEPISYEKAANLLIEVLETKQDFLDDIAKHELGRLGKALKLSKKHKVDQIYHDRIAQLIPRSINVHNFPSVEVDSQCIRSNFPGSKKHYIDKDQEGMTIRGVEQVALEYYDRAGYPGGEHCEGTICTSLLILFFWDIIYNPPKVIPGTFLTRIQTAPLDMFTPYFYKNRKELIDARLREIGFIWSDELVVEFAKNNWQKHSHEKSAFGMIMNVIRDIELVNVLVIVIGRKILAKIFQRLLKSLRVFSSGMPDLLVWNVDEKICKFAEVKGEGDALSTAQKLWLRYLHENGAQIEVCWVHSTGSKRKKMKNKVQDEAENPKAGPSAEPE